MTLYRWLADTVLVLHFGVVLFVVGGLVLIVVGNLRGWMWVNWLSFRLLHLLAIVTVVIESWFGIACPLTVLEHWLRQRGGMPVHGQGFIEFWVQRLLFYDAPLWVFALAYSAFALLVVAAWWRFPPSRRQSSGSSK